MSDEKPDRDHLDRLTRSCLAAPISRYLGRSIEIPQPGAARVRIPFHPELTQNSELLHGAVLFEVADTAGFVAANSLERTYSVLTVSYNVSLLRPVKNEGICAVAEVVHRGRRWITARSEVFSDSGRLVALGQGIYAVSEIRLADVPGYLDEPAG
jgi:uncharacterized protein (TIGR00369 family)